MQSFKVCVVAWLATAFSAVASSQALDAGPPAGTVSMEFEPFAVAGKVSGCILNFRATQFDHYYKRGALVAVMGSFNVNLDERAGVRSLFVMLKVGTRQVYPSLGEAMEAPEFAYLQTANGSTSSSVFANNASNPSGYRILGIQVDVPVAKLLADITDGMAVTLGFNREKGGKDILVPLDIRVVNSRVGDKGLQQVLSDATLTAFRRCFSQLAQELR